MRTISKTISLALLAMLLTVGSAATSMAQYGYSSTYIRNLVNRIQTQTATLRSDVRQISGDNYGTDSLTTLIADFATATNQLNRRLNNGRATSADAQVVLDRAALIDSAFVNNRVGITAERDWQSLRTNLSSLARAYNLNWQGGATTGSAGNDDYNLSDLQMRQLVQRIDSRTTAFSRNLRQDLSGRNYNDENATGDIRSELTAFETSVAQLRNRINSRRATSSEAHTVLDRAATLNTFVADRQLSYQTENNWTALRQDLERLASAYNIAWNWSTVPAGPVYGSAQLTGTYRLAASQADDARRAAESATRSLPSDQRQRAYDALMRRLDPPDMLAIDQRGTSITIASTRAPQINFVADGREQSETTQNGRTVRVRATLVGDQLSIVRTGERAQDFTVTFDPQGNRMLVTRSIYTDQLTQPVVVRSYYDRTSEVAQLNLYETNPEYTNRGTASGDFVIPNGTQVVATLNNNVSTQTARDNDRFSMTVRSPSQYEGATIEGYVTNVDRAGRVTGRAAMTLNFDTIKLRDGRTYRFAGILDSVRGPNGDIVRVDNEGAVREEDSQTNRTVTRTAIGTAVGAIIGAIAGGGKGAAIGAVIGAGAGAGSVYVQGRNDLDLDAGTEVTVRATGPR
ncbi:MAG: YMGG-like glycine zipper-containing protein [Pyrinomonadaceae bacterium]